jgi:hypothetical protein
MTKIDLSPIDSTYGKYRRRAIFVIIILCITSAIFAYFDYLSGDLLSIESFLLIVNIIAIIFFLYSLPYYKKKYLSGELPKKPLE